MRHSLALAATAGAALTAALAAPVAHADGWSIGFGFGVPAPIYAEPPGYYAPSPPPMYSPPPPPPSYYQPAYPPGYAEEPPYYGPGYSYPPAYSVAPPYYGPPQWQRGDDGDDDDGDD